LITIAIALHVGATVSQADIIHYATNFVVGDVWDPAPEELFELDVDSNGTVDFSLVAGMNYFSGISSSNPDANKYLIHSSPPPNIGGPVAALDSGYLIGSNTEDTPEEWFGIDDWSSFIRILDTGKYGEFYNYRGYVGLEFEAEDGIHYGWLDIEGVYTRSSITIRGWAYESIPGVGIVAGVVPEPSSVVLFAIGAIGAWTLRKRKTR
jgi:hypothetical protein